MVTRLLSRINFVQLEQNCIPSMEFAARMVITLRMMPSRLLIHSSSKAAKKVFREMPIN